MLSYLNVRDSVTNHDDNLEAVLKRLLRVETRTA